MSLDDTYGPYVATGGDIRAQERLHAPVSLDQLNRVSAGVLKTYLDTAITLKMPPVLHSHVVVLWVVDEAGDIHFALEELIDEKSGRLAAVRPRGDWGVIAGTLKLGHPSLLRDPRKHARIGGEIVYNFDENRWEINNLSGRYGLRPHQTQAHLEAVAGKFNEYGISLFVDFESP